LISFILQNTYDFFDSVLDIEVDAFFAELVGLNLCEIENIVDEEHQDFGAGNLYFDRVLELNVDLLEHITEFTDRCNVLILTQPKHLFIDLYKFHILT
jgi:hypothetical protein